MLLVHGSTHSGRMHLPGREDYTRMRRPANARAFRQMLRKVASYSLAILTIIPA